MTLRHWGTDSHLTVSLFVNDFQEGFQGSLSGGRDGARRVEVACVASWPCGDGRPGSLGRSAHSLWVESLGYEPVLVILLGVGKYHWCMVFKEPRVVYSAVGRNVIWAITSSFGENLQTKVTSAALRSLLVLVLLVSLLRPSGQPRQSCLASSTCCCFFSTCSRIVSSNHLYPIPSSAN